MSEAPKDAKDILLAALQIHDPTQRAALLDQSCQGDATLRRRVEDLLRAYGQPGGPLEKLAAALAPTDVGQPLTEQVGAVIGPYKLMEQIGEGGFGLVFVAEQQRPLRRKVALKIIKPGMDTRDVIGRFEAERQALALMDHPNIARVLDAGTTESGRPYFVMELVRGIPITDYCDQSQLTPRERLDLFISVCNAVQHAHQKGIIHRDIKPSNVLVTLHDGKPVVKVIDFGVAKALHQKLTEQTVYTRFAQMIGTPLYMSPEQAEMSGLDIDTRSDVYSLGVLLYELLTGTTPFDRKRFAQAAYDQILKIIREEEPPKPSTRLSQSTASLPTIAAQRRTDAAKLSRMFRGDLDWITMKALEKDRTRRYGSARELAEDIERWDRGDPIIAKPPTFRYLLGKYVRRNRLQIATVSAILVAGIGAAVFEFYRIDRDRREAIQSRHEADEARAIAERAREQAQLRESEARQQKERTEAALLDVDRERKRAEENFRQTRQAVDKYFTLISESRLMDTPGAEPLRKELLTAALDYYKRFQTVPKIASDDAEIQAELAAAYFRMVSISNRTGSGDWLPDFEKALAIIERLVAQKTPIEKFKAFEEGITDVSGSPFHMDPSSIPAATKAMERIIPLWEEFVRQRPKSAGYRNDLAAECNVLANLLVAASRAQTGTPGQSMERSLALQRRAYQLWKDLAREYPNRAHYRAALVVQQTNIGSLHFQQKNYSAARAAFREAEAIAVALANEFPAIPKYREELALAHQSLAGIGYWMSDFREAIEEYRRAIEARERVLADFPTIPAHRQHLLLTLSSAQSFIAATLQKVSSQPKTFLTMFDLYAELREKRKKLKSDDPTPETVEEEAASPFPSPSFYVDPIVFTTLKELFDKTPESGRAALIRAFADRARLANAPGSKSYRMAEVALRWWAGNRKGAVKALEGYALQFPEDSEFQIAVVRGRSAVGGPGAETDRLDGILTSLQSRRIDLKAARDLLQAMQQLDAKSKIATQVWEECLQFENSLVRRLVIAALPSRCLKAQTTFRLLEQFLSDPDSAVRIAAARRIAEVQPKHDRISKVCASCVLDSSQETRILALDALAAMGPNAQDALPNVKPLVADASLDVRLAAARAIWRIAQDRAGLAPLSAEFRRCNKFDQHDVAVRLKILKCWGEMGRDATEMFPVMRDALETAAEAVIKSVRKVKFPNGATTITYDNEAANLTNAILQAIAAIDPHDKFARSGYPSLPASSDFRFKVVTRNGTPLRGATVSVFGYTWTGVAGELIGEMPPPVKTNRDGYAYVSYPGAEGTSKEQFQRNLAMRLTLGFQLKVTHPGYVSWSSPFGSWLDDGKSIVLQDAATLSIRGKKAGESRVLDRLCPVFDTTSAADADWECSNGLLQVRLPKTAKTPRPQFSRVVHLAEHGSPLFSEFVRSDQFGEKDAALDLTFKPGVRIQGRLSEQVPRPIKGGRITAKVQRRLDGPSFWEWVATAPIDSNGGFVLDALPPDENVQIIAECEGWISESPKLVDLKKYSAENKLGPQYYHAPIPTVTFPLLCRSRGAQIAPVIPMERAAKCEITVLDEENKPIPKATVALSNKRRWQYHLDQELGDEQNTLAILRNRVQLKGFQRSTLTFNTIPKSPLQTDERGIAVIDNIPATGAFDSKMGKQSFASISHEGFRSLELHREAVVPVPGQVARVTVHLERTQ